MAHTSNKKLGLSAFMALVFFGLLIWMFLPHFGDGTQKLNALEYSDHLFNSISKGSSDYIPAVMKQSAKYDGTPVEMTLHFEDGTTEGHEGVSVKGADVAAKAAVLLGAVGAATVDGAKVVMRADMGALLNTALTDALDMFNNRGDAVRARYGMDERETLFIWWKALMALDKELKLKGGRENVAMAKAVSAAVKKGVEVGYNYYGIEPENAADRAGVLTFSLVFYVAYTLWWGMCIFYFFEGIGLVMGKGHKQEA